MNSDYNKHLETEIHQALKKLPDLKAPDELAQRIMTTIARRASARWYRQSWQTWPAGLRVASVAALLVLFGCLCFGGWEFYRTTGADRATRNLGAWLSGFSIAWETIMVLIQALVLIVKRLGTGFMVACLTLAAFSYFTCIGLGTVFVRYAFSRR